MTVYRKPPKAPKRYSHKSIASFYDLGNMIQKELLARIRGAPRPAEQIAVDHIISIGIVNFMKNSVFRPVIVGGLAIREDNRLLMCRFTEGEIYHVRVYPGDAGYIRTSRLGMSGAFCYTPSIGKRITAWADPLDASCICIGLTA